MLVSLNGRDTFSQNHGVNFTGPVMDTLKPSHVKTYISLFVCLDINLVHMELIYLSIAAVKDFWKTWRRLYPLYC